MRNSRFKKVAQRTIRRKVYDFYRSRNLVEEHNARVQEPDPGGQTLSPGCNGGLRPPLRGVPLPLPSTVYCRILNRIEQAGMTAHLSPQGLLLKLSKVYAVGSGEGESDHQGARAGAKIAERLKLDILPET
ncbi:MAG: hypothetical protein ACOX0O_02375 [Candidatus Methanoculleus thermohydrogenotrophicum]|jgi:hypothetical protein